MQMLMTWLRRIVSRVPIYGQLVNSDSRSLGAASSELAVATIFSLFPIWLYPIVVMVGFQQSFWTNAKSFIENGELFLFSSALIGPLIYSITKKYDEVEEGDVGHSRFPRIRSIQFPYEFWFVFLSILTCLFAAIFFGLMRVSPARFQSIALDEDTLFWVSVFMYFFTLSCFFCASVYRLNLENTAGKFGEDTRDLLNRWGSR